MKATEQYFPVALFFMLHKMVLTFESVDYSAVILGGVVKIIHKVVQRLEAVDKLIFLYEQLALMFFG